MTNNSFTKVVVLGGSGFIGSHVADELSKKGNKVIIFDKNTKIDIFDELIELGDIIKSKDYKINYNKIIFN